ncbi:hypothetical protein BT69DRAFT_203440 [Atractiella rhizophila]|nr:hypothetical protein BT69DRAFT_203440 [Atractiella rhizophila]
MTTQTLLTPTSYTSQSSSRTKLVKPSASPVPVGYTDSKGTLHHTKLGAKLGTRRERREREDELSKPGNVRGGRRDVELEGIEHDLEHTQFRGATPNLPRRNSKRTTSDSESVASSASSSSSGERFPAVMNHRKNSYTSTLGNGSGSFNSAPRRGSPKSIRDRQAEREERERLREQRQRERLERMSGRHYGGSGYESKNRVASDNAPPLSRYASGVSSSSTTFGGGRGRLASETMKSPLLSGGNGGGFQGGLLRAASISSSSYTPQLVVPVAPRTVGKDLRFEKLVPTAPSYRPKNVTDTSAGNRLWGKHTLTSAI